MRGVTLSERMMRMIQLGVLACLWSAWVSRAADSDLVERSHAQEAQELFSRPVVRSLRVELAESEVEALKKDARKYARATIREGTTVYQDVGLHLKGAAGSYRGLEDKPALTLGFGRFVAGQRFHGLRRIHLNNSVQDASYLNENLSGGLFRAAGVPAARVAYASVEVNGRKFGLYVLKEGFTKDLLKLYFKDPTGNLYDMEPGREVTEHLQKDFGEGPDDWSDLKALAAAAQEPDGAKRWRQLQQVLDVDRFLSFMAIEVMTCHWDGYCLGRNNFRIYQDRDTGRMIFFPHGMDQMFGVGSSAGAPWKPNMSGLVAQAIIKTPEGRRQYRQRFATLLTNVFQVGLLTNRINELTAQLRPVLPEIEGQAAAVKQRIAERALDLQKQLSLPEPAPASFTNGEARVAVWRIEPSQGDAKLDQTKESDGKRALHIRVSSATVASWRSKVLLEGGRYRFEGVARTAGVVATRDEKKGEGAGIRISGSQQPRNNKLSADSPWQKLEYEFAVADLSDEVDLVCELRASQGEVWFDVESLKLVRLK